MERYPWVNGTTDTLQKYLWLRGLLLLMLPLKWSWSTHCQWQPTCCCRHNETCFFSPLRRSSSFSLLHPIMFVFHASLFLFFYFSFGLIPSRPNTLSFLFLSQGCCLEASMYLFYFKGRMHQLLKQESVVFTARISEWRVTEEKVKAESRTLTQPTNTHLYVLFMWQINMCKFVN